jgi:hypothetical protein
MASFPWEEGCLRIRLTVGDLVFSFEVAILDGVRGLEYVWRTEEGLNLTFI